MGNNLYREKLMNCGKFTANQVPTSVERGSLMVVLVTTVQKEGMLAGLRSAALD